MTERDFVLKWAHIGGGRSVQHRHILDEQRQVLAEHIKEIQAEQEERNATLHKIDYSHIPPLRVADRYASQPLTRERKL